MNGKQNGRRLDGYIRVSQVAGREGDSFISPQVQEKRIRAWAVANGHTISDDGPDDGVWLELDVSGGTMNRPKLNEIMRRIEAGESDGLIVFNLSRFARTTVGSIELVQRINERGALFASVSDGFDITTVTGRMVLTILLAVSQGERERLGESWRTAKVEAVGRGIHISPNVPFGYKRGRGPINPKTGKPAPAPLEVDPETAWAVPELFRRRAAGESWERLRRWLAATDLPTVRGAGWTAAVVQGMIRNRVYLGEARGAGPDHVTVGAHEALIDELTWQAAQLRGTRFSLGDNGALLRGLIRCGSCRYMMQATKPALERGALRYHCNSKVGCPHPARITGTGVNDTIGIDDAVVDLVREWEHGREEEIAFDGFDPALDIEADERQLAELVAAREQDRLDEELRDALGRREWVKHLADLTKRVDEKQAEIVEKQRQLGRPDGMPHAEFWEKWDSGEMSLEEKRAHLAGVIQAVFVNPAAARGGQLKDPPLRRRRYANRVHVVWQTDAPLVDIPRQGHGGYRIKPWPFPAGADPDELGVVRLQPEVEDAGEPVG